MTRRQLIHLLRWVVAVEVAVAVLLVVGVHTTTFVLDRVRPASGVLVTARPGSAAPVTVATRAPAAAAGTPAAASTAEPPAPTQTSVPEAPPAIPTSQPASPTATPALAVVQPTATVTLPPTPAPTAPPSPSPTPTVAAVVAPPAPATPATNAPALSMDGRPFSGARLLRAFEEHGFALTPGTPALQGAHQSLTVTATKGGASLALTLLVYPNRGAAATEWLLQTPALPRPGAPRPLAPGEVAVFNENAVLITQHRSPLTQGLLDALLSLDLLSG